MKRNALLKKLTVARILSPEEQEEIKKEIAIHVHCLDGKIAMCIRKYARIKNMIVVFNTGKQLRDNRKIAKREKYISLLEMGVKILDREMQIYYDHKQDLLDQSKTVFAA